MNFEKMAAGVYKAVADSIDKALNPVLRRLDLLEARQLEKGEKGDTGEQGPAGKDADPIEVTHDDLLTAIKSDPSFLREVVADYLKENPPKDGADGKDGANGKDGINGIDGKDGAGATGAMIDKQGELIITLSNGELQRCGMVVGKDGSDGSDGKDGADLSDLDFEYDGEREISVKAHNGTVIKSYKMPVVIDKGYWRDGCKASAGDSFTFDGSLWIAQTDTKENPSAQCKDWRLAVRKGRDGRAGRDLTEREDKPVKI